MLLWNSTSWKTLCELIISIKYQQKITIFKHIFKSRLMQNFHLRNKRLFWNHLTAFVFHLEQPETEETSHVLNGFEYLNSFSLFCLTYRIYTSLGRIFCFLLLAIQPIRSGCQDTKFLWRMHWRAFWAWKLGPIHIHVPWNHFSRLNFVKTLKQILQNVKCKVFYQQ